MEMDEHAHSLRFPGALAGSYFRQGRGLRQSNVGNCRLIQSSSCGSASTLCWLTGWGGAGLPRAWTVDFSPAGRGGLTAARTSSNQRGQRPDAAVVLFLAICILLMLRHTRVRSTNLRTGNANGKAKTSRRAPALRRRDTLDEDAHENVRRPPAFPRPSERDQDL